MTPNRYKNMGPLYTGPWYLYYYLIKELWAMPDGRLLQQAGPQILNTRHFMNISIERLKSCLRIFLTALTMTLVLAACPSTYESGDSGGGGGSGNNCQAGYCNSNGYCCPQG